jgi:hypothetical protein
LRRGERKTSLRDRSGKENIQEPNKNQDGDKEQCKESDRMSRAAGGRAEKNKEPVRRNGTSLRPCIGKRILAPATTNTTLSYALK